METYRAHVLVVPYPAQGHINPMLQFCKRLVSKGVKATVANSVFLSKSMSVNPYKSINFETISDGFDNGGFAEAESSEAYIAKFRIIGSKTLADLIQKLENSSNPVHALVYDSFLPWALDVAKQFGLVGAAFSTQLCSVMNIYCHVQKGLLSLPLSDSPVSIAGLPLLHPSETPSFIHIHGSYPGFFDMLVSQFSNIEDADWLIFNSFHKMEENALNWTAKLCRVITIGPTIPSKHLDKRLVDDNDYSVNIFKPDSELCLNWLENQPIRSVVYISFGSWSEATVEQLDEIASALKESGFKFLWVVREFEREKLPNNFIEEISTTEKGLIVTWCPQLDVLAHKSTACFVTHSGFNSVLETLSLGVPVVAMPLWTDQSTNGKFVEDVWGVGLRARPDEKGIVRREVLVKCLREIMEGEKGRETRKNAAKWKELAREAVDDGGSSDKHIDEFVAELARSCTPRLDTQGGIPRV